MGMLVCELLASGGKVCHTHSPTGFRVSLSLSTTCLTLRVLAYVPGTPAILGAKALDPELHKGLSGPILCLTIWLQK